MVEEHLAELTGQLTRIIEAGVDGGHLQPSADPEATARAVFHATGRFHDPRLLPRSGSEPGVEDDFTAVVDLLLRGLRPAAQAAPIPPCTARSPASAGSASGSPSPSG